MAAEEARNTCPGAGCDAGAPGGADIPIWRRDASCRRRDPVPTRDSGRPVLTISAQGTAPQYVFCRRRGRIRIGLRRLKDALFLFRLRPASNIRSVCASRAQDSLLAPAPGGATFQASCSGAGGQAQQIVLLSFSLCQQRDQVALNGIGSPTMPTCQPWHHVLQTVKCIFASAV